MEVGQYIRRVRRMIWEIDFGAREADGAAHPEYHHTTHAGQPDDQAQSAWVYEKQVLLDKPDLLLRQGILLIG